MKEIKKGMKRFCLLIKLILSKLILFFAKNSFNNIWLINETPMSAQDNGLSFFKYMNKKERVEQVYFVIEKKSSDYKKLKKIGNVVEYNSFRHILFYLVAEVYIITHDLNTPNWGRKIKQKINMNLKGKIIQVQHGVTYMESTKGIFYKDEDYTFITAVSESEKKLLNTYYKHPEETIKVTGLCRFDYLEDRRDNKKILFMPTWRKKLEKKDNFINSEYYKRISSLLTNKDLLKKIKEEKIILSVYLHIAIQNNSKYLKKFENENIKILTIENSDCKTLLEENSLMITDYSSVSYDFSYIKKPVIFYQWNPKKFAKEFELKNIDKYQKRLFGEVVQEEKELIKKIKNSIDKEFKLNKKNQLLLKEVFKYNDRNNCRRLYEEVKKL